MTKTREHGRCAWALTLTILSLTAVVLSGCGGSTAGSQGTTDDPGADPPTRPADFTVTYSWHEGTVAPEYYSEYEITIGPGNSGVIRYSPTYPGDGIPVWTRRFEATSADLDELYRLARADDAFRQAWERRDSPLIGGSGASATLVADGHRYDIPSDLTDAEATSIAGLYPAITSLVPEDVWDELEAKRTAFNEQRETRTSCDSGSC